MIDIADARERMGREPVILPDAVPDHPLLAGRTEIGRGEYSIVLDHDDPERVYKVVGSPADLFLYTADDRPRGPHFPVVHASHGAIGRASSGYLFHLLEMERLFPLREGSTAADLANRLIEAYWFACQQWSRLGPAMGRVALYHLAVTPAEMPDSLKQALKALSDFVEDYQVMPDLLNANNLMERADGTLVFSDPVFIA